jgi:hypothetical protein
MWLAAQFGARAMTLIARSKTNSDRGASSGGLVATHPATADRIRDPRAMR